jgi:phosphoserine phosphatase RsbU/P
VSRIRENSVSSGSGATGPDPQRPQAGTRSRRIAIGARQVLDLYTKDLTTEDLQHLFTHETPEAYRFFTRGADFAALASLPWHRRMLAHLRLFVLAFSSQLSPARRAIYGVALVATVIGLLRLFTGIEWISIPLGPLFWFPIPTIGFVGGAGWLLLGVLLLNLLLMLELADRLPLKRDLEVAREIQQAMLPRGTFSRAGCESFGVPLPPNTVGGDFYDIIPLTDGRVAIAVGDVAGKGTPAALLMALLLAMLRTLIEEGLPPAELVERLNLQVARHAPPSRFLTLFYAVFDPGTRQLVYVNAGHPPPLLRRRSGELTRLWTGGMALGLFDRAEYRADTTVLAPDAMLVAYSDGVTEAENRDGQPLDEAGLERVLAGCADDVPARLADAVLAAVEQHVGERRFADDLTLLILTSRAAAAPSLNGQ